MRIPAGLELFVDTNIFLYSITIHSKYGKLCGSFFDRIKAGELKGKISVLILNELIHKLIIGEVSEEKGYAVQACDPYVKDFTEFPLFSLEETVECADCLVLLVNHKEFKGIDLDALLKKMRNKIIIDTRGVWRSK